VTTGTSNPHNLPREELDRGLAAAAAAMEANPPYAFAVLTPSEDTNWGWRPQLARFFVDREQALGWGQREKAVVVALPIIADYRPTMTSLPAAVTIEGLAHADRPDHLLITWDQDAHCVVAYTPEGLKITYPPGADPSAADVSSVISATASGPR